MSATVTTGEREAQPASTSALRPPDRQGMASWLRRRRPSGRTPSEAAIPVAGPELDLAPDDPAIAFFQSSPAPVDIRALDLASPGLSAMRAAGVVLVAPLISSGELIGLLTLGRRLSEREYSTDDRQMLATLAGYAAPAIRVGQLVREQEAEARDRERIEQELRVAQLIQQQFLPQQLPELPTLQVAAYYRPARQVGGDFYDFLPLGDGRVMLVVGDVTDKGVPAALVMASTHALLRSAATRLLSPGEVLAQVNDQLCEDIPQNMFVTCFALAIEPATGHLAYANAGHDVPYLRRAGGEVDELHARGMPLGLMASMNYEEKTTTLGPGEGVLLHSDGLVEAHSPEREMFGFPRLAELVGRGERGERLLDACLTELAAFTGPSWGQEDDITLVSLERSAAPVYEGERR